MEVGTTELQAFYTLVRAAAPPVYAGQLNCSGMKVARLLMKIAMLLGIWTTGLLNCRLLDIWTGLQVYKVMLGH
jgi:hypothetical protein